MNSMRITKVISCLIAFSFLSSCGNSGDKNNTTGPNKATTEMPEAVQKLTGLGGGTLRAYITIDGDGANRTEMTIDGSGAGSASGAVPGLSRSVHTVLIEYEFTVGVNTITLATASNSVDLSSGSGSISFVAGDYNLGSHDFDSDGISNAAELGAGGDPFSSDCELDLSLLDSCTLG